MYNWMLPTDAQLSQLDTLAHHGRPDWRVMPGLLKKGLIREIGPGEFYPTLHGYTALAMAEEYGHQAVGKNREAK